MVGFGWPRSKRREKEMTHSSTLKVPSNDLTVQDFQREVAVRAANNKTTLPVNAGIDSPHGESEYAGDLTDIYQRVDLEYRRSRGQFFTPPDVAAFMVRYGIEGGAKTMLDPACGLGIFIDKMLELYGGKCNIQGIDNDPSMVNACHLVIKERHGAKSGKVKLYNTDYLESDGSEKVDFLVCNPPYINFHDFDRGLVLKIRDDFGVKFSMLTNIYALFMVRAKHSVKDGGRIAFITPSEFFYTGYGKTLKKFLLENFTIDSFITFDFDSPVFEGALTTATISLMINKKPESDHHVRFIKTNRDMDAVMEMTRAGKRNGPCANTIRQDLIDPNVKWQCYFEKSPVPESIMARLVPLSRMADVKRGIATGSNAFFILSDTERKRWNIEDNFLVPVISRATQIRGYEVTKGMIRNLARNGEKIHLLYCFEAPSRNLHRYIKHGECEGVNDRYLCAHRLPWYSMERRMAAPILSTTFSRDNMRFVHNKAGCLNLASYHGIYPRFDDTDILEALLCYLNSDLCMTIQKRARREYGNGLHKFEPRDLLELPTMPITEIGKKDVLSMASLFRRMVKSGARENSVRDEINDTVWEIASSL